MSAGYSAGTTSNLPTTPPWHDLVVLVTLIVPAILVVQLQAELTNRSGRMATLFPSYMRTRPWDDPVLRDIFNARPLAYYLIRATSWATEGSLTTEGINVLLQTLAAWLAFFVIYRISCRYLLRSQSYAAALLAALLIPWGFLQVGQNMSLPYDLPALLISALGILFLVRRQFWALAALLLVGTLNKETTIWLVPAYGLLLVDDPAVGRVRLGGRLLILGTVFCLSYYLARVYLTPYPAESLVTISATEYTTDNRYRWYENVADLLFQRRSTLAQNVYWVAAVHLPAILFFGRLPHDLKCLYLATPFFLIPIFLVGNTFELRLFNELIPLGAVSFLYLLSRFFHEAPDVGRSTGLPTSASPG